MVALPKRPDTISDMINEAYVRAARTGDGLGIGMSQVINPCSRALWYGFRWCAEPEMPSGQRERIFETGNVYERRLLAMLRMIGCEVVEVDEATGGQFRVELIHGHLRGKLDAIATRVPGAPIARHVVECKSANDKSFKTISKGPIRDTKPEHFAQIQLYMHAFGIDRGLYMVANKNTDEVHTERVAYDPEFCAGVIARIEAVVLMERPPARLHDDPDAKGAIECRWCPAFAICHEGAFARRNCRTCMAVTAQDGPRWVCELHEHNRTYEAQQQGCADHRYNPAIVPGEQVDADASAGTITYRLANGDEWVDGTARAAMPC